MPWGEGIEIKNSLKTINITTNGHKVNTTVNQLLWKKGNEEQLVYYFYKAGDFIGPSYVKLRFKLAINKLLNNRKSGALIRISTPIISGDLQKAADNLYRFINELYPFIVKYL